MSPRYLAVVLFAASACSKPDDTAKPLTFPNANVVLITLDTTRADHLSCYGYPRKTTPHLDRFAEECVKFTMAFAQSSFTPPSHASILTGRYPTSHGLTWWDNKLDPTVDTLAECLGRAKYASAMFSPLGMGLPDLGNDLGQGFDRIIERNTAFKDFRYPIQGHPDYLIAPGDELNKLALKWIGMERSSPFFTWHHYYDAHRPFAIFTRNRPFVDDSRKGDPFGNDANGDYQLSAEERAARGIDEADAKYLVDRYDSGLLDLDAKVGVLLDELRKSGALDRSIVVITADHGEAFAEYDEEWFTHDPFLFDAVTHVPLLVRLPNAKFGGESRDQLVQLIDVMPTILDYLDVDSPELIQGVSLRPVIENREDVNDYVASERRGRTWEPGADDGIQQLQPEKVGARRSLRWRNVRLVVETHGTQVRLFAPQPGAPEVEQPWDPESHSGKGQQKTYEELVRAIDSIKPDTKLEDMSDEQLEWLEQNGYIKGTNRKSKSKSSPRPKEEESSGK